LDIDTFVILLNKRENSSQQQGLTAIWATSGL